MEPLSYGGYIYQWPSKYDQVFWPYTDAQGIWFCESSGYLSFMSDFENLSEVEIEKVKQYLSVNRLKHPSTRQMVEMLESINALRSFTPEYRNSLTRVYARWHQEFGDLDKSRKYRKAAYDQIQEFLKQDLSQDKKIEYLYLAANYSRHFDGVEKSDEYIQKFNLEVNKIDDPELSGYVKYLSQLIKDTQYIGLGGEFEPAFPEESL